MLKQYVIAIGGPLGSLQPLTEFFDHTPLDNASYIILQHLPFAYQSVLGEILQRHSKPEVIEARQGIAVENDKVYFAPPARNLMINDGTLRLTKRIHRINPSFDIFLESLAKDENKGHAIARKEATPGY